MNEKQSLWQLWREDYKVHGCDLSLPGFRAVAAHRFGVWRLSVRPRFVRAPLTIIYRRMFRRHRNRYGIEIPHSAVLGRRVRVEHQGGIVVHGMAVIGDDVILRQGVTIGNRHLDRPDEAPVIGSRVNIGSGAAILGAITIGDDVSIGSNAVVIDNVPSGSVVVGPRATIHPRDEPT